MMSHDVARTRDAKFKFLLCCHMDQHTCGASPSARKEAPEKRRRLNQEPDSEYRSVVLPFREDILTGRTHGRDLSPVRFGESSEPRSEKISSEKVLKSQAQINRDYRSVRLFLLGNLGLKKDAVIVLRKKSRLQIV